jgi:hypothetical protein
MKITRLMPIRAGQFLFVRFEPDVRVREHYDTQPAFTA